MVTLFFIMIASSEIDLYYARCRRIFEEIYWITHTFPIQKRFFRYFGIRNVRIQP